MEGRDDNVDHTSCSTRRSLRVIIERKTGFKFTTIVIISERENNLTLRTFGINQLE